METTRHIELFDDPPVDPNPETVTRRWVSVLLRGGGFRPCLVTEYQPKFGSERYTRIERQKECYLSYKMAEAEAEYLAEKLNVQFRRWP